MLKQRVITAVIALAILLLVLFVVPAALAKIVIAAVVLAGAWGWRLEHGRLRREDGANLHGLLGTLAMLFGGLAAAAGMVLLP